MMEARMSRTGNNDVPVMTKLDYTFPEGTG